MNESALIADAAKRRTLTTDTHRLAKVLDADDLSALFGLEIAGSTQPQAATTATVADSKRLPRKKLLKKMPARTASARAPKVSAPKAKGRATRAAKRKVPSKR